MSAPLSPLEIRLERFKRASNARLDFLKRLGNGGSIGEKYLQGNMNLHLHFFSGGEYCIEYKSCIKFAIVDEKSDLRLDFAKFPMFISIGDITENGCPLASLVRLKPLDCCYMSGVDAAEPTSGFPMFETLCAVFDRELSSGLFCAGIKSCQSEDEIIERTAQVVTNLPDDYANHRRNANDFVSDSPLNMIWRVRILFNDNGIFIPFAQFKEQPIEFRKVFLCPTYTIESAIEAVRGHATISS
jgi:hypothetical protein